MGKIFFVVVAASNAGCDRQNVMQTNRRVVYFVPKDSLLRRFSLRLVHAIVYFETVLQVTFFSRRTQSSVFAFGSFNYVRGETKPRRIKFALIWTQQTDY